MTKLVHSGETERRHTQNDMDDRVTGRQPYEPSLLLSLTRHDDAARLMFLGLQQHYLECIASGRLSDWARAGHAAIDLLACVQEAAIVKRDSLRDPVNSPLVPPV